MSTINLAGGNTLLSSGSFPPVRAASTGAPLNPAAGGLIVVDGVQLVAGDRVLCKDETNPVNNGIYAANTGPWVRTTDAGGNMQFFSGMAVTVALGAVNAGQTFICTCTDDPVVVGTSLITWASQSAVATATQAATSTTSLAISTGSKTLAVPAGKAFQAGQWVLIQETSNSANQMLGQITAYSGTSLTVNVTATGGSGTHADWTIVLTNSPAAAGYQPPVGSGNVTGPGLSMAGHVATFADATGKVLADGGALIGGPNTILPSMLALSAVAFGVGMLNGKLVASVAGNALTIAVKTLAGADPSSSDPAFFVFRDATNGYAVIEQTAALNITVPAGATLGTVNGQANRIWVGAFNNAGAAVLGVYNSLMSGVSPTILPWDETSPGNGTGITASSTSPQIWYTASTLSSAVFRILGYVESTQTTAGQWASTPSKVQLFGPGIKRPGDVVQSIFATNSTADTTTSATFAVMSHNEISIALQSACNPIRVRMDGSASPSSNVGQFKMSRGTTANSGLFGGEMVTGGGTQNVTVGLLGVDLPNTTSSTTYALQANSANASTVTVPASGGGILIMQADEIQI